MDSFKLVSREHHRVARAFPYNHIRSSKHSTRLRGAATMSFPHHQPELKDGYLYNSPTQVLARFGACDGGGFTLVSGANERRWHVIKAEQDCHFGQVLLAVELSSQYQGCGSFAIKVPLF